MLRLQSKWSVYLPVLRISAEKALKAANTYQNEDPAPSVVATDSAHVSNTPCKNATECSCQTGTAEEEGDAILSLVSLIPHAQVVNNSWE